MDPGGAKKFLYTGTRRQAEEEDQWSFAPKGQDNSNKSNDLRGWQGTKQYDTETEFTTIVSNQIMLRTLADHFGHIMAITASSTTPSLAHVPVDLKDVWSIEKNVSVGGTGIRGPDRLTHNASKGFYSRHGGLKDGTNNSKAPEKSELPDGGSTWSRAPARVSSFSYSYTGNTGGDDTSSIASSHVSRGYHSNPSPRRFDRQGGPVDENDF